VTRAPSGIRSFDVEGPVQAEVFVLWLDGDSLALTGPCGAQPWYIEVGAEEDPLDVVAVTVRRVIGEPTVAHSTSWRRDRDAVVLSFVVVIEPALAAGMESVPVARAELARSTATAAPSDVATAQVVEHGLRHLAWLAQDDPVVRAELAEDWRSALAGFVPEPFRSLG
jgi:hypothetical protein